MVTIIGIGDTLSFSDGSSLSSDHDQDCCESHYLSFNSLTTSDVDGLEFDLSSDDFFEKVPGFGIRLKPINGHDVSVPGYGYNNGYYSSDITLILEAPDGSKRTFDVSECQDIKD